MRIYLIMLGLMNVIAFAAYGMDKAFAKSGARRIPERMLLLLAFVGGAFGAGAGMLVFRHKTRKPKFRILVPIAIVVWIGISIAAIRFLP